jgi:F-type H+-transporting ATPase subunit epsilon
MVTEEGLLLEVVTPLGVVLCERVEEVVAPSVKGEFGVLPGHLPMLASLNIGLLHFVKGNDTTEVAVGRGFAEVLHDRTLVLTDRYATKEDVDVLAVRERLTAVDGELEEFSGDLNDPHRLELIEEEQWLATQLELMGDPPQNRVLIESRAVDFNELMPQLEEASPEVEDGEAPKED